MAESEKASEASKVMRDPKTSHEEKSKAASELGKSRGGSQADSKSEMSWQTYNGAPG